MSAGVLHGIAVWRDSEPGVITVTRDGETGGEPFQGPAVGPPGLRHLVATPWAHTPGSGWEQDETGAWHVRVFRHGEP